MCVLQELVPEIVELVREPKPVPLYVVELMESLVKTKANVTVLDHAIICMQSLLSDAIVANVRKAAILASVTVFKAAFGVSAEAGASGSSAEVARMWQAMCSLKAGIQALMTSPTASDSVKHMAMKFVEQAVLMYSAEEHPFLSAGSGIQSLRLVRIPRPHPFLSTAEVWLNLQHLQSKVACCASDLLHLRLFVVFELLLGVPQQCSTCRHLPSFSYSTCLVIASWYNSTVGAGSLRCLPDLWHHGNRPAHTHPWTGPLQTWLQGDW